VVLISFGGSSSKRPEPNPHSFYRFHLFRSIPRSPSGVQNCPALSNMAPAYLNSTVDRVVDIARVTRGWVALAYVHYSSGESQLGFFPWAALRHLDGADSALAQLVLEDPMAAEKIARAEMANPRRSNTLELLANPTRDVGDDAANAPSTCMNNDREMPPSSHSLSFDRALGNINFRLLSNLATNGRDDGDELSVSLTSNGDSGLRLTCGSGGSGATGSGPHAQHADGWHGGTSSNKNETGSPIAGRRRTT
jgi:hypothetical protein